GFNRMNAGLREREQLRDLFGRHVGEDVARAALERGIELGGEELEVAAGALERAGAEECRRWREGEPVRLRGRTGETRLATPNMS
ncbi:MAG: hypothetical protein ACRDK0_07935, partial [Solirubrobacteraceae bacterium]